MNRKAVLCAFNLAAGLICSVCALAQVPVRLEPRYIHTTPSLFVMFSAAHIGSQEMGGNWTKEISQAGNAWYRSFVGDTLVHRVANLDTLPFHVCDIEILSGFNLANPKNALPFPVIFENELAFAYKVSIRDLDKVKIQDRGSIIIALISGAGLIYYDEKLKQTKVVQPGNCLYTEPGSSFYLSMEGRSDFTLVLLELK